MDSILTNVRLASPLKTTSASESQHIKSNQLIAIKNGKIAYVGCSEKFVEQHGTNGQPSIINGGNALVTAGLIDCHTHLIFAGNRATEFEQRLNGASYTEIAASGGGILSTVRATRAATEEALYQLALPRLYAMQQQGVTAIEIKSGYGLTLEDELKMLRVAKRLGELEDISVSTTLLAAHALPPEYKNQSDAYIDHIINQIIPAVVKEKLADSVDIFCEGIGFTNQQAEKVFQAAIKHGLNIKGHTEQLSNQHGSALAAKMGALSVDHIEYLDEKGVQALAKSNTVATLLPGAFYFLNEHQQPPVALLRQYGVDIAVATDFNPGTSPIASIRTIMNMGCTLFGLTPQECLLGVTENAAKALGWQHQRGKVCVGMDADLAIWNLSTTTELCQQIGTQDLIARMVNGQLFKASSPQNYPAWRAQTSLHPLLCDAGEKP